MREYFTRFRALFLGALLGEFISVSAEMPVQPIFSLLTGPIAKYPAILVLIPPVLELRGNLFGILCGRITTALHLGSVEPRLKGNTDAYRSNLVGIILLAVLSSGWAGALAYALSILFHVPAPSALWHVAFLFYILVAFLSAMLATLLTIPITLFSAFQIFKHGLDPDMLVYPLISSVSDFLASFSLVVVVQGVSFILVT